MTLAKDILGFRHLRDWNELIHQKLDLKKFGTGYPTQHLTNLGGRRSVSGLWSLVRREAGLSAPTSEACLDARGEVLDSEILSFMGTSLRKLPGQRQTWGGGLGGTECGPTPGSGSFAELSTKGVQTPSNQGREQKAEAESDPGRAAPDAPHPLQGGAPGPERAPRGCTQVFSLHYSKKSRKEKPQMV